MFTEALITELWENPFPDLDQLPAPLKNLTLASFDRCM
jgi:hypothetical protein